MNYKKQKIVNVPEPKLVKDPRSATVSNGTKRMLPDKKKTAGVV